MDGSHEGETSTYARRVDARQRRDISPATARGPAALLDDYAAIADRRGPEALVRVALRTRSLAVRELLAHLAAGGKSGLREVLLAPETTIVSHRWAAALGRVIGLQAHLPNDQCDAARILEAALAGLSDSQDKRARQLLAELHYTMGHYGRAHTLVTEDPRLLDLQHGYLFTDLLNPFSNSPYADQTGWAERFADHFKHHHLAPPVLTSDRSDPAPFDQLQAEPVSGSTSGPLVSVIMTTYRPQRGALLTSITSILRQSWQNLELIIIDDCSPDENFAWVEEFASFDSRITVKRMPHNGGTYLARNAGLELAEGDFVTGQDDDDWSHPERIARQVAPLIADSSIPGTWSMALRANEQLILQRPGYSPYASNASSLMVRRLAARTLGGFFGARRGADTEFRKRIEIALRAETLLLEEPLALVRMNDGSLSRGDFRPGWKHPARRAFQQTYSYWLKNAQPSELSISEGRSPVPLPPHIAEANPQSRHFDVVFAGDWGAYGGPQKSMIEEITALAESDLHIGVMHFDPVRFMTTRDRPFIEPIQRLVNAGVVAQVTELDLDHIRLLLLRYPPILQFPPPGRSNLNVDRLVIVANQAPSERDGSDIRYRVSDVTRNARDHFGVEPLWAPQGPSVREAVSAELDDAVLTPFDIPGILDVDAWVTERVSFRSDRPVIGRHSRDTAMKWPGDPTDLRTIYPIDGSVDVRIMGGSKVALNVLQQRVTPDAWVVFPKDALPVRTFLNSIDFFVYFQHSQAYDAFGRAVLEALATGCVCVLPAHMEPTFGPAALYAEPYEVQSLVKRLYADPDAYRAQSLRALDHVRSAFGPERYRRLVSGLLDGSAVLSSGVGGLRAD